MDSIYIKSHSRQRNTAAGVTYTEQNATKQKPKNSARQWHGLRPVIVVGVQQ